MKKLIFQGVGTALVTPFIEHLINFEEYKKMLELSNVVYRQYETKDKKVILSL